MAPDLTTTTSHRSGREKVAILLLALGEKSGTHLLQKFDPAEVKHIMSSATALGRVDKLDLDKLVDDFAAEFARAIGLGTDFGAVKKLVDQAFTPSEISTIMGGQVMPSGEPAWKRFPSGSENILVPYLLDEHPQTVAFILSKLDPELAARCLSILPGDFRNTVHRRNAYSAGGKHLVVCIVMSKMTESENPLSGCLFLDFLFNFIGRNPYAEAKAGVFCDFKIHLSLPSGYFFENSSPSVQILSKTRYETVPYTHLRAHETVLDLVCRLLLEKKKNT